MTVGETILSKDGRAIVEVCRQGNVGITYEEAERIAGGMRALFKKGSDGQLCFATQPQQRIHNSSDDADSNDNETDRGQKSRNWRLFLQSFRR